MKLIRISALVLPFIFYSNVGWSGCTVTQDDGGTYTDNSVRDCRDYYPEGHACQFTYRNVSCQRMDMFFAVDWDHADLINNAHRGVWGLGMNADAATDSSVSKLPVSLTGAAENSFAGAVDASTTGWRSMEYDIFMMRDPQNSGKGKTVTMGHYTDMANFADYPIQRIAAEGKAGNNDGFLMGTAWSDITDTLYRRDRDGYVLLDDENADFMTLEEFIANLAYYEDMVIVLDPKFAKQLNQIRIGSDGRAANFCIGFCDGYPSGDVTEEGLELLKLAVEAVVRVSIESNKPLVSRLIFKLPQSVYPNISDIKTKLGSNFNKVLFAPGPDASGRKKLKDVVDYVDSWIAEGGGKHVAFWDTSILSYTSSQGSPFTRKSIQYKDLTDYLKRRSGKRSAIWAQDLSGPGGRHGNYYMTYTNYPSDINDVRGDLYSNLYLTYSKNAVITTDRPDVFLQMKAYLKTLF